MSLSRYLHSLPHTWSLVNGNFRSCYVFPVPSLNPLAPGRNPPEWVYTCAVFWGPQDSDSPRKRWNMPLKQLPLKHIIRKPDGSFAVKLASLGIMTVLVLF